MKTAIHALFERTTGYRLLNAKRRGVGLYRDVARFLPALRINVVIDVGANIGQSASEFLCHFPKATIHCLEPSRASYDRLVRRFKGNEQVRSHNIALGADARSARLLTGGPSDMFRIGDGEGPGEIVRLETLDRFLTSAHIPQVDFIKIDAEGLDFAVLQGGKEALRSGRLSMIQVEAGMSPDNETHIPFEIMKEYLEGFGYRLFGIFEQVHEFPTHRPFLRRTNPVFISPRVILENTPK